MTSPEQAHLKPQLLFGAMTGRLDPSFFILPAALCLSNRYDSPCPHTPTQLCPAAPEWSLSRCHTRHRWMSSGQWWLNVHKKVNINTRLRIISTICHLLPVSDWSSNLPVKRCEQVFLSLTACSYNLRELRLEPGMRRFLMVFTPCLLSGFRKMTMGYHCV